MDGEVAVIDVGSGTVKAGYSGEDAPRSIFPTVVGRVADPARFQGSAADVRDAYVGAAAQAQRGMLDLVSPVTRGRVTDVDALQTLLEYTFAEELCVTPEAAGLPVLLTDCPNATKAVREQMAQVLFEAFKVPGFCVATQSVLSLFASGRTRGVVLESGAGVTHAVPVFEGYALPHAIMRSDVGGMDLTAALEAQLTERGLSFAAGAIGDPAAAVRTLKEAVCYVAPDGQSLGRAGGEQIAYELPDSTVIGVDHDVASCVPEILFQPSLLGADHESRDALGCVDLTLASIAKCDEDLQADLYESVVLAGGNSMFPGFTDRVGSELRNAVPHEAHRLRVIPDSRAAVPGYNSQRKHAAWIGGSMFASLPTFGMISISKQEYEDNHASIVHRKCF